MASAASSGSVQILLLICTCFLLPLSLAAQGADDKNSVELVDSQFSFSFNFSNASSYQAGDLKLEGNASVQSNRIDLTCDSRGGIQSCKGRMSYSHPVAFYDDTGALACFSTSFTFVILADNYYSAGDGLAFFLSDYPFKMVPDSEGGHLGLISETTASQNFVAVEFDTYRNYWDPSDNHIGVDINSIHSSNYTNLMTNGLPSLNGTMTAKVQFDNTTNMLLASLRFHDYPHINPVVVTYVLTDPKSLLPGQVEVGFSSTSGTSTELHQILAWSFNSTLAAPRPHKALLAALLLAPAVALLVLPFAVVAQQWVGPWSACDATSGNYSAGSAYANSTLQLILGLQINARNSPALFATGSTTANAAAAVYGLMLCRGDLSASDCFDCGTRAWQDVQRTCNRTRDAALVYNQCYVRVAGTDFLASADNTGQKLLISGNNISGVDVSAYDAAVTRLLNATARYAVGQSPKLFATGQLVGLDPKVPNIWSMAQCASDLSPELCRRCLDDLVARWWKEFPLNGDAARIAGSRCNLRSELGDVFYTGSPMVKLQMNGEAAAPAPSTDVVPATAGGKNNSAGKLLGIILPIVFVAVVAAITLYIWNVRKKRRSLGTKLPHRTHTVEDLESIKSTLLSLSSLQVATNYFDESSKLGEGGFGAVYKGDLSGQEVAVKRLSKGSNQGLEELRNELVLVAKLHHKNLVRLEGFCLEEGERLLVYEYMANKSLDTILFDPEEKRRLDWRKRFNIIEGIARGLQYLHEDSQKKIVHRDMKASNVLLDADMNPKIGDFGLARLFEQDQTRDVTNRIVGTFGYMSPEYVMRGQYSTKSDVFSFGILVIEIITGQRNTGHYFHEQNEDIISIVWRHWSEGTIAEMIDDSLGRNYSETEVLKCVNIGLLCLQQNPVDRPTMSDVMVMLNGDATSSLPPAARPTFFLDPSSGTSGYSYASGTVSYPSAS